MLTSDKLDIYESSKRLRNLRTSKKISHKKLAEDINVSEQLLKNYEQAFLNSGVPTGAKSDKTRAIAGMSISTLYKLANYFQVSADYLLGFSPNPTTDKDKDAVCKYTGLSQESISRILDWNDEIMCIDNYCEILHILDDYRPDLFIKALNDILISRSFPALLSYIINYIEAATEAERMKDITTGIKDKLYNDEDYINEAIDEYTEHGIINIFEHLDLCLFRIQESAKELAKEIAECNKNKDR